MREHDIRPEALMVEFFARLKVDATRLATRSARFVDVPCPFCGGAGAPAFTKDGFPYRLCDACASLFASPRPGVEDLLDYAVNSSAVEYWSTHFYRQTEQVRRERIFRPRAELAAELCRDRSVHEPLVVDVGAGYGLFLEELRQKHSGARLIGIEPDARLAAECRQRGFDVITRWVEDLEGDSVQADLVTAFEVIEHVFDPAAFLRACAQLVKPGGILLFTTLTIDGFDLQMLWDRSRQISPPQHLNFPSVAGIERLLPRVGLMPVSLTTPGALDVDIVCNAVQAGGSDDIPRFALTLAGRDQQTRTAFQLFLQEHRLSSHLRCIATRA